DLFINDLQGQNLRIPPFGRNDAHITAVAFSADGNWLHVAATNGTLARHCARTGKVTYHEYGTRATHLTPTPDGERMFVRNCFGGVRAVEAAWPPQPESFETGAGRQYALTFSPDGTRLAAGGQKNEIRILDVATVKKLTKVSIASEIFALAFTPDGKTLA